MTVIEQISQLPKEEKLKIFEELWDDLGKEDFDSPKWHGEVLSQTKDRFDNGEEKAIDWDTAKKALRN